MVGAYGNSWIRTPQLDRLASESFVFDQAFVDSPQLEQLYRAYWLGLHSTIESEPTALRRSLPKVLKDAGIHTVLVTDEPDVATLPVSNDFNEQLLVESPLEEQTAADVSETRLARLFGAAIDWLEAPPRPFFLWLHARGLGAAWDAPLELRNAFAEDEDPQPPDFVEPPSHRLSDDYDPDELLGIVHAYAGQISVLDACVGALLEHLLKSDLASTTQLAFLSARGFPLGEHNWVGPRDEALYNETIQIPWLMRFPDGVGALVRSQALVQPPDLPGTLLEWLEIDRSGFGTGNATSLLGMISDDAQFIRDRTLIVSGRERAIRTAAWFLREGTDGAVELFAKPGDRWEVNEVAKLCPDIVTGLQTALAETGQTSQDAQQQPLADVLVAEVD
jgi:arylsulfatase A-like enzyme